MRIPEVLSILALTFALSACAVVPVIDHEEVDASACKTYTRNMSLKMVGSPGVCPDVGCLAAHLAVLAGSTIISGSIVLTGNTVHWLEYQGTCSESYLNITRQRFLDSINKPRPTPGA